MATHEEFLAMLEREVRTRRMTEPQMEELLVQKAHFDAHRQLIEQRYRNRVVGYARAQLEVADTVHELLGIVKRKEPGSLVYFEPIGFTL